MAENKVNQAFREVALRHKVAEGQIPDILKKMQLNPADNPSEAQLKGFEEVCKLIESGMDLDLATQTVKNTTREEKTKKQPPEFVSQDKSLAVQEPTALREASVKRFEETVPGDLREAINEPLDQDAAETVKGLPGSIANSVDGVKGPFHEGLEAYVKTRWTAQVAEGLQKTETLKAISEALQGKHQPSSPKK
jgi:hypothetical protein